MYTKSFCIYMLIQRCGFVNDKIHTFEYLFVFNKFFDIFSYIFNKGVLRMFWERVEALAAKEHITIKNMLIDLNMSLGSFSNWKKRGNIPSGEAVSKIAKYFNVSTDYLLGNTDIPTPPSLDEQMDGIEFALFGEIKDLTDEQKQEILDYVRFKQQQNEQKNSH